ncbi:SRPBCC family protein [Nocardia sp. XZ_19_231]|uniref:SRPBCC family protein n=1 Tax=Nocardia sp. XZ_19_231 TaxID=2769252 RepID=UPI00188E7E51|nr:SRPBCC family protein [Nocardia sp. XZ_19_231]
MAQRSNRRRQDAVLITSDTTPSHGLDQVRVSGEVSLAVAPETLWRLLSQPEHIASWMSELHAWTGPTTDRVDAGRELAAQVQMFHMIQDVHLVVTEYRPTRGWTMTCSAVTGVAVAFTVEVEQLRDVTRAMLRTSLHGQALRDADVVVLRHAIQSGLDASLRQLADIAHPDIAHPDVTVYPLPVALGYHPTRDKAAGFT